MQAIIHATDELALLQTLCQLITQEAAYPMAWVGYVRQDAGKTVEAIAWMKRPSPMPTSSPMAQNGCNS
jgi:hypothetical protein